MGTLQRRLTMIYVTGDTHGSYEKFALVNFPEQIELTKNDYVIICGDFGIWDDSARERINFDWLENKNFTTLFVDGNHENYDLLNAYPVEKWHGGEVHFIRPSVIHLMRGNLFDIEGKKIFTMGGASSHDIQDGILDPKDPEFKKKRRKLDRAGKFYYRIKGVSWWEEELPTDEEIEKARKTLDRCDCSGNIALFLDAVSDDYGLFEEFGILGHYNIYYSATPDGYILSLVPYARKNKS